MKVLYFFHRLGILYLYNVQTKPIIKEICAKKEVGMWIKIDSRVDGIKMPPQVQNKTHRLWKLSGVLCLYNYYSFNCLF